MKKQLEVSIIDNNIFYNLLQRASSSSKNKNNFIIYDMSGGECLTDDFQNFISINEDVSKLLNQGKDESVKLTEIQKILSKEKEELFSKSKRYFNFLLVQPKDSEFINLFNQVLQSLQKTNNQNLSDEEIRSNLLLHSGQIKIECDLLANEIQKKLQEHPDIEANCSQQISNWRKTLSLYKILRNNKINEIHILRESAQSFFNSYPFMHNYFISLNSASQQSYPNDILFNRMYFGNWKHASNEEIINSIGITHIVNMTCEVDNYFASNHQNVQLQQVIFEELPNLNLSQSPSQCANIQNSTMTASITTKSMHNSIITTTTTTTNTPMPQTTQAQSINSSHTPKNITYLKINIEDEDTSNIQQHFKETYQFIASAISKPNNKILIHCAQGKSRSATIVCMYLMRTFNWSFDQTLKYVQDRREVANPNYGFVEQLKSFEQNQFMFDGESLDEFAQSKKQNQLSQVSDQAELNESNSVKKQLIQNFEQSVVEDIQIAQ
ncbi:dual specificity phosphatase domain protein (macronuclear) [Tetrahymena thermophila SB210]|uniref:protein-tyrosine-phosphatase n=1 Tax=Tetrahymena thermophila (strain SB210) TaxID=312017 RepID=Q22LX5_TETTS|nr:dual specificity phosphatase domain protein [Tetrahymena thermophila SB210]EAR86621.3 dual specificity phosphatase domain protein [Tetrahymena thermophila SB210]|eukprot:XP_977245.3 dual specificity phosphatase domain protein [Tetrahymena thermophila SB210]